MANHDNQKKSTKLIKYKSTADKTDRGIGCENETLPR